MPSRALQQWRTTQRAELDLVEATLRRVPGRSPVERAMRQRLVDAYILLLAGHFQLFCRDLHSEAAGFVAGRVQPPAAAGMVRELLTSRRLLDRGNASSATLAADFGRLDVELWRQLELCDPRNNGHQRRLDQLNVWRNAIAHQDFAFGPAQTKTVAGSGRSLRWTRLWRGSCSTLAEQLDVEINRQLRILTGAVPW
jgi:hypothetical protein